MNHENQRRSYTISVKIEGKKKIYLLDLSKNMENEKNQLLSRYMDKYSVWNCWPAKIGRILVKKIDDHKFNNSHVKVMTKEHDNWFKIENVHKTIRDYMNKLVIYIISKDSRINDDKWKEITDNDIKLYNNPMIETIWYCKHQRRNNNMYNWIVTICNVSNRLIYLTICTKLHNHLMNLTNFYNKLKIKTITSNYDDSNRYNKIKWGDMARYAVDGTMNNQNIFQRKRFLNYFQNHYTRLTLLNYLISIMDYWKINSNIIHYIKNPKLDNMEIRCDTCNKLHSDGKMVDIYSVQIMVDVNITNSFPISYSDSFIRFYFHNIPLHLLMLYKTNFKTTFIKGKIRTIQWDALHVWEAEGMEMVCGLSPTLHIPTHFNLSHITRNQNTFNHLYQLFFPYFTLCQFHNNLTLRESLLSQHLIKVTMDNLCPCCLLNQDEIAALHICLSKPSPYPLVTIRSDHFWLNTINHIANMQRDNSNSFKEALITSTTNEILPNAITMPEASLNIPVPEIMMNPTQPTFTPFQNPFVTFLNGAPTSSTPMQNMDVLIGENDLQVPCMSADLCMDNKRVTFDSELQFQVPPKDHPLRFALIGKFVHGPVELVLVLGKFKKEWAGLKGEYWLEEIGNEWILFKFGNAQDRNTVWNWRPYHVQGRLLALYAWYPEFNPFETTTEFIDTWIRIPNLPNKYHYSITLRDVLEKQKVGNLFKLEGGGSNASNARYLRACINTKLAKGLEGKIYLCPENEIKAYDIWYEDFSPGCGCCGSLDHVFDDCHLIRTQPTNLNLIVRNTDIPERPLALPKVSRQTIADNERAAWEEKKKEAMAAKSKRRSKNRGLEILEQGIPSQFEIGSGSNQQMTQGVKTIVPKPSQPDAKLMSSSSQNLISPEMFQQFMIMYKNQLNGVASGTNSNSHGNNAGSAQAPRMDIPNTKAPEWKEGGKISNSKKD